MFIPERVESALKIFDVMNRADEEFVPLTLIQKIYNLPYQQMRDLLHVLKIHGVVKTKRGALGGYALARSVTLHELFVLFSPSSLPDMSNRSSNPRANTVKKNVDKLLKESIISPRFHYEDEKINPLER